jgi:LysR family nitrogen assimilation transcriptional regulator
MDLKELHYFRAIAEAGTFAKAAAELRVAQPALSRQMRKLEHNLGVELLNRSSRGVTPTPAGLALLRRTVELEEQMEDARREVCAFSNQVVGSLRIAAPYPISTIMLPELLTRYRERFPSVALHAIEGFSGNITDSLLQGGLDVAIASPTSHLHVDLTVFPLFTSELRLVAPASAASLPLFANEVIALSDLSSLPMIMPSSANAIRRIVENAFTRHQMKFVPTIESDGQLLTFAMVQAGLGYTLFPHATFAPLEDAGELISRSVQPKILRTIAIITRTKLLNERPVAHFVEMAKAATITLAKNGRFRSISLYENEVPAEI